MCGEFGIGYHNIGSNDLKDFERNGLGNISQKSGIGILSLGIDSYLFKKFQISFLGSWSFDGYRVPWKNALGSEEEVEIFMNNVDLRIEIQPLFPFLQIYPYFSIGKTILCKLVDSEGDGFRDGGDDFHYSAGIDIPVKSSISQEWLVSMRIGVVYKPSFAFKEFKIVDSVPVEFEGKSISIFMSIHFVSGLF